MSSTVIAKNVQIGADGTASNNFTIFQPATPDGTLRIGNGNTGITSSAVALTSAGNVGIGTSSTGSSRLAVLGTQSTTLGSTAQFVVSGGQGFYLNSETGNINRIAVGTGEAIAFNIGSTERARFESSGNFLVGATSSATALGFNVMTPDGDVVYTRTNHKTGAVSGSYYAGFYYNGAAIGTITQNGTTATAYNTSSDYRLKHNIAPMTGALAKVAALKPVTYKWNADNSDGEGFIAHELAEVCPDAVTGGKDAVDADGNPQYQGIDTSFLVATLTAAIQEQQAIITALTARVTALEGQL